MRLKNLLPVFWFFLVTFPVLSAQKCGKTGLFRPQDKYATNRHLLLSSLASNVSARGGYYNASVGQGPDRVYAVGMCFQGAEPQLCSTCIEFSFNRMIKECLNQTEGLDWTYNKGIPCMIHYSNHSFFGSLEMSPFYKTYDYVDFQVNLRDFGKKWDALMSRVIADATSPSNPKYYGAGIQKIGNSRTIYGFVQCRKDISPWNCSRCLRENADDYRLCYRHKTGGVSFRPSCYMQWDVYPFYGVFEDKTSPTRPRDKGIIIGVIVVLAFVISVLLALGYALCRRRKAYQESERRSMTAYGTAPPHDVADDMTTSGIHQFDFKAIEAATSNFQKSNKLGHGGFGEVYKGTFPNGTEVAVKRLSKTSGQGEQEFKNEVLLVAKLQHRNLVRLLGFSVEGEEKILVYEFVRNRSLDYFLFDHKMRGQLDWRKRYNIIGGITRGILYLHQDSRLTIIHRDLKASNILLDVDMNPKIADFGMARNFSVDQTEANTGRVVGTFGYMPPEYVANGQFSMKSDVYSFGVLILEIIVGKSSSNFHQIDGSVGNLVTYVWRLWNNESVLELVDPEMGENYDKDEVIRCIHISLLCVQENPADRPSMSTVFQMLTNTFITLPVPQPPGFLFRVRSEPNLLAERFQPGPSTTMSFACSINDASITSVSLR